MRQTDYSDYNLFLSHRSVKVVALLIKIVDEFDGVVVWLDARLSQVACHDRAMRQGAVREAELKYLDRIRWDDRQVSADTAKGIKIWPGLVQGRQALNKSPRRRNLCSPHRPPFRNFAKLC